MRDTLGFLVVTVMCVFTVSLLTACGDDAAPSSDQFGMNPAAAADAAPSVVASVSGTSGMAAASKDKASAALKQSGWYAQAIKGIETEQYRFTEAEGAQSALNPGQNFRLQFDESGWHMQPDLNAATRDALAELDRNVDDYDDRRKEILHERHTKSEPDWRFHLQFEGLGRAEAADGSDVALQRFGAVAPQLGACDGSNRKGATAGCFKQLEYRHKGVTEFFRNLQEGIEHGFTIDERPQGEGAYLVTESRFEGLNARAVDEKSVSFHDDGGERFLYKDLSVKDARGQELSAHMAISGDRLRIVVDDTNAVYPIEIDPLGIWPDWLMEVNRDNAHFGYSLASAGDVNGDHYADVIIGAPGYNGNGMVFVYQGGENGLSTTASWSKATSMAGAEYGCSVSSAGDVNNDGYADIIIGACKWYSGKENQGAAFLYMGSSSGLAATQRWSDLGDFANEQFGYSLASAGDVNGDGYDDVIIGTPFYTNLHIYEGAAFLYLGSTSGLTISPVWVRESNMPNAFFGGAVDSAGDVNGDGFDDVIVGSPGYARGQPEEGVAFVYHGSSEGLSTTSDWSVESDQIGAALGISVAGAGDINGDGFADVIIGASRFDDPESNKAGNGGKVYVYHGSDSGLASSPAWTTLGYDGQNLGASVASAGDVNGDNHADVIIGAPNAAHTEDENGIVVVYFGSEDGLSDQLYHWTEYGEQAYGRFGERVASAGDVNGDGFSDILIAAPYISSGQNDEGFVYLYMGSADRPRYDPDWTMAGSQEGMGVGWSVASAGDVNGDGYGDVVIGAPNYDTYDEDNIGRILVYLGTESGLENSTAVIIDDGYDEGKFGWSVASAGDVNGDGFGDLIIGAPGDPNDSDIQTGKAYLFMGSGSGIETWPVWSADGNGQDANFGWSVASAGDVNGDGYSDVIIGSPGHSVDLSTPGAMYLYLGSPAGLGNEPDAIIVGDQDGEYFGGSVASAGDVNGDGFSDIIIGAKDYDNHKLNAGRVCVYMGSVSGLDTTPVWTAEGGRDTARFGASVAPAGDVNADGFSDVIIGSTGFDGLAYVYLGSVTGLQTTPDWTGDGGQYNSKYGHSVSSAGDINGDGYSDVIVGAHYNNLNFTKGGFAQLYPGSESGVKAARIWSDDGESNNSYFGYSVASVGDVNGDGFGDVLISAPGFNGDRGKVYLYLGNNGGGLSMRLMQWQAYSEQHIHQGGFSTNETELTLSMWKPGPLLTEDRVKMQVEFKPAGEPFDGTDLYTTPNWEESVDPSVFPVPISMTLMDLEPGGFYHWRARLVWRKNGFSRWYVHQATGYGNAHHVVVPGCGNKVREGLEECDSDEECCMAANCVGYAAGTTCGDEPTECSAQDTCDGMGTCLPNDVPVDTACGDSTETECSGPDSCDGEGICQPNDFAFDTACGEYDGECDVQDSCDGAGSCVDRGFMDAGAQCGDQGVTECSDKDSCDGAGNCLVNDMIVGTSCGSSADTDCTDPDSCDGVGNCLPNDAVAGTDCGDAGTECTNQDTCDGSGTCTDNGFQPADTACGDAGTDCINQDLCDGAGACVDKGFAPSDTVCGDAATECSGQDRCNGLGVCLVNDYDVTAQCDDGNACTHNDHCDGAGDCGGTAYSCQAAACESASSCDGLGGCNATQAEDGAYCDDDAQGDERCYSGDCLAINDGETCDRPIRLEVDVAKEFTLDGMLNTYEPPESCSSYSLAGPEAFFDIELQPGRYMIEATPDSGVDIALVLMESCDPPTCVASQNDGGQGERESYGPLEIGTDDGATTALFAVESPSDALAGGFQVEVYTLDDPDGDEDGDSDDTTDGDVDDIADGDDDDVVDGDEDDATDGDADDAVDGDEDDATDGDADDTVDGDEEIAVDGDVDGALPDGDADDVTDGDLDDQDVNAGAAGGGGCQSSGGPGQLLLLLAGIYFVLLRRRKSLA